MLSGVATRQARRAAIAAVLCHASGAAAGPPYITDDPQPTDLGHWEIYVFGNGSRAQGAWDGAAGLDLNYGAVEGIQLTSTLPINFSSAPDGRPGVGDVELGLKYRFLHRERAGFGLAVFPRLFLPTASSRFGSGRLGALFPLWAQKDAGKWAIFGGSGYALNPGAGNRDYWQSGVAATRTVSARLSLGGEVVHRTPDAVDAHSYVAFNLGGGYKLGGPFSLIFSGGPGIVNARRGGAYNLYTALAILF